MENGIANTIKISNKQCIKARLQSLQRARLSPCRNVRMTKNFVRGLGPRGPRVQSLVHKDEGRVHTLRFLAGNSTTFFFSFCPLSDSSRSVYSKLLAEEAKVGLSSKIVRTSGKILATSLDISLKES